MQLFLNSQKNEHEDIIIIIIYSRLEERGNLCKLPFKSSQINDWPFFFKLHSPNMNISSFNKSNVCL